MAWDTGIPTFSDTDFIDKDDLNQFINNLNYLKDPDVAYLELGDDTGDYALSSATFVNIGSEFTYTATMKAGYVMAVFTGAGERVTGTNSELVFGIFLDGVQKAIGRSFYLRPNGNVYAFFAVTAGSRTVDVRWKQDTGTGVLYNLGKRVPTFYVREISWTP